jgi:FkbM family methyltransferase
VVDNNSRNSQIHGITRWNFDQLRANVPRIRDLLGIDFTASPYGYTLFKALAQEYGLETVDFVQALAELNLAAIYQEPNLMRTATIARRTDYQVLRDSFADDLSRETLDAFLDLRLTFRRERIRDVFVPIAEEYFSTGKGDLTFQLRPGEAFCDAGAYVGSSTEKFIAATKGVFHSIHAFEPDQQSFAELSKLATLPFQNLHLHKVALGETTGIAAFNQTGTMGSHVVASEQQTGAHQVAITRLDDMMDYVTFIKMDLEGFEAKALRGGVGLIARSRPRMAIAAYHYADDLLEICETIRALMPGCKLRLRHHSLFYFDTIVYAEPA